MATPDITDKLINQSKNSLATVKPKSSRDFIPEIPSSVINSALPSGILDSLKQAETIEAANINRERVRIFETGTVIQAANREIDIATKNIQAADSSILLDFQGMFDPQYNRQFQQGKIEDAQRKLKVKDLEMQRERQQEALDLKEASLPKDMYIQQVDLRSKLANMSAMEANAIIQSNAAKTQRRKYLQQFSTDAEIESMNKTNTFTEVWRAQDVQEYLNKKKDFNLNMATRQLALDSGRTKLATDIEVKALSDLPTVWAKSLLAVADKTNASLVKIPGTSTPISTERLRISMANRETQEQDAFAATAASQLKLAKNNAEWSTAIFDVKNISSMFSGDSSNLDNMENLNMLNITDKTLVDFEFDSIHPEIRADVQSLFAIAAVLNEKSTRPVDANNKPILDKAGKPIPAAGITLQDSFTFKQAVLDLKKKTAKLKKDLIETTTDKGKQAGIREYFSKGFMEDQGNSAAVIASSLLTLPNFVQDQALSAAHQTMKESLAKDIVGDADALLDDEGNISSVKVLQALASSGLAGKVSSRNEIMKALNTPNKNGKTPVDVYTDNRVFEITLAAMHKLGDKYPEYKNYFDALKRETKFVNPAKLAESLAELSFRIQRKDETKPDMFLNEEFLAIANQHMASNRLRWNSQMNYVRGSFINLMFNTEPSIQVDNAISSVFGTPSRKAWSTLQEPTFSEQRETNQRAYEKFLQSEPVTRPEANVFGTVPLPVQ